MDWIEHISFLIVIGIFAVVFTKYRKLDKENRSLKIRIEGLKSNNKTVNARLWEAEQSVNQELENNENLLIYLKYFIYGKIKIYSNNKFYSQYEFYNGRYYVRIPGRRVKTNIEGVPVIALPNSKHEILDLYLLQKLLKTNKDKTVIDCIDLALTEKDILMKELGDKILRSYKV